MFSVVLFQPEIPPNTGNIIRLCANTGCDLHLIQPLGFTMDEKQLRRAGLDYHQYANVTQWPSWSVFSCQLTGRLISFSTKNKTPYSDFDYQTGDIFLFGSETSGLPDHIRAQVDVKNRLTIPMRQNSRSLNLSNSVAIVIYEAWRQNQFAS